MWQGVPSCHCCSSCLWLVWLSEWLSTLPLCPAPSLSSLYYPDKPGMIHTNDGQTQILLCALFCRYSSSVVGIIISGIGAVPLLHGLQTGPGLWFCSLGWCTLGYWTGWVSPDKAESQYSWFLPTGKCTCTYIKCRFFTKSIIRYHFWNNCFSSVSGIALFPCTSTSFVEGTTYIMKRHWKIFPVCPLTYENVLVGVVTWPSWLWLRSRLTRE